MTGDIIRKQYLEEVNKHLKCPRRVRKRLLCELEDGLCNYLESHPDATMDELYAHFGSAEELAMAHLELMDSGDLQKEVHRGKTIRRVAWTVGIIAILVIVAIAIWLIIDKETNRTNVIEIQPAQETVAFLNAFNI